MRGNNAQQGNNNPQANQNEIDWYGAGAFLVGALPAAFFTYGGSMLFCLATSLISGAASRTVVFPNKPSLFSGMFGGIFGRNDRNSERDDDDNHEHHTPPYSGHVTGR